MGALWLSNALLLTPKGVVKGSLAVSKGRIAAIRPKAPRSVNVLSVDGAYVAPGFIDLHVWGEPDVIAREAVRHGTTAFLTTLGPEPAAQLERSVASRAAQRPEGAACLGIHLEGPFVNPTRGGALPRGPMRPPAVGELRRLASAAHGRLKLVTLAPELRGATSAIRWCARRGMVVSLGHSDADARMASDAVTAGASAVTHVFNGMRPLHHRQPALLDVALTDTRLVTMVIADGVHVGSAALRLLRRVKGAERIALVTDSIRHQGWDVRARGGAYYLRGGTLAGSRLTMLEAVRNMMRLGGASLVDAVRMATEVPARLLHDRSRGLLAVGRRADLVVFDPQLRVRQTWIGGRVAYER